MYVEITRYLVHFAEITKIFKQAIISITLLNLNVLLNLDHS